MTFLDLTHFSDAETTFGIFGMFCFGVDFQTHTLCKQQILLSQINIKCCYINSSRAPRMAICAAVLFAFGTDLIFIARKEQNFSSSSCSPLSRARPMTDCAAMANMSLVLPTSSFLDLAFSTPGPSNPDAITKDENVAAAAVEIRS
jgi:hypothetical protein